MNRSVALIAVVLISTSSIWPSAAQSPSNLESVPYDCTDIKLDNVDDALLTKEERIAKMDGSLNASLDAYTACMAKMQSAMAASAAASAQAGGGKSQLEGQGGSANSGNESAEQQEQSSLSISSVGLPTHRPVELSQPKDNTSIICRLLWEEIQKSTGDKRTGFEQQYKDYKCS